MSHHDDYLHDAELGPVIDRLQSERPTASALEFDLIKQRVRGRVTRNARRSRRTEFMRSRLAILGMLVLGMVLSTGGAGLAVSGFASQNGNAAQTQYGTPTTTPTETTTVVPEATTPAGGVLGEDELLERCYLSCFDLVRQHRLRSVSFPAISCGVYGFPIPRACRIALAEIRAFLERSAVPREVWLVAFDATVYAEYAELLRR